MVWEPHGYLRPQVSLRAAIKSPKERTKVSVPMEISVQTEISHPPHLNFTGQILNLTQVSSGDVVPKVFRLLKISFLQVLKFMKLCRE